MLELSILALIVLAGVYWTALWLMGRHEDVLYGDFVTSSGSAGLPPPPAPQPPPLLVAPEIPRRPRGAAHAAPRDAFARPAVPSKGEIGASSGVGSPALVELPRTAAQPLPSRPKPSSAPPISGVVPPAVRSGSKASPGLLIARAATKSQDRPTSVTTPPMALPRPTSISRVTTSPPRPAAAQNDVLASLLETIKRDLGNAVGK